MSSYLSSMNAIKSNNLNFLIVVDVETAAQEHLQLVLQNKKLKRQYF